ncbi:MAG: hypothetical protein ACOZF0_05635 [Thermodesulfobacteriota bacterium]
MIPDTRFAYAPLESRRFQLNAYRGFLKSMDADAILAAVLKHEIDLLIIRLPAEKQCEIAVLNELGMPFIIADTLVWYHADISGIQPKPYRNPDLSFIEYTSDHFELSDRMVQEIFTGYWNNYSANPLLEADLVEIYRDWTRSYATDRARGKFSWLVGRGDDLLGLITCLVQQNELEVVLNGVLPREARKGVYGDMIRFIQGFCLTHRIARIRISTQANNYAVQKVWGREGFHLKNAFVTIHVNSMMKASRIPGKSWRVRIAPYGSPESFDMAGIATAEKGKMTMGRQALLGWITTGAAPVFVPREGATLLKNAVRYVKPLKPGMDYRVDINHPYVNPAAGAYTTVLKVYDETGDICLFAYYDFREQTQPGKTVCGPTELYP